jgi:hypothetical protein
MKERSVQDQQWLQQKQENERSNRLLLSDCFYKGKFFREGLINRETFNQIAKRSMRRITVDGK